LRRGIEMYKQNMNQLDEQQQNDGQVFFKEAEPKAKPAAVEQKKTGRIKQDTKYTRVAKFLILIGAAQASGILAELEPQQVEEISKEIALIKVIKPQERDEILAEFQTLFSRLFVFSGSSRGGIETARRILYAAKGPEKGEALLNRAVPETKENIFSFLEEFSTEQLVMLLKEESPQTSALILSRMPPKISAETISSLPPSRKADILKRIANQQEVAPEILEQVSAALKEKVRNIAGAAKDIKIDGMQALAAILKQGDYSFTDKLINEIEDMDPEIGQTLKDKLYTLDDVINAVDRPVQNKLKMMTDRDIAVLLKGRKGDFCEKILSCISAGRRKTVREEIEILGAVPKRECDAAAKDFLSWFRAARENGEILLFSDEDVYV